eukprot:m.108532 g.108532  ORF g.108532 m.108532 type:complete len:908 (-) comp9191_c1_seq6:119-2842(-)
MEQMMIRKQEEDNRKSQEEEREKKTVAEQSIKEEAKVARLIHEKKEKALAESERKRQQLLEREQAQREREIQLKQQQEILKGEDERERKKQEEHENRRNQEQKRHKEKEQQEQQERRKAIELERHQQQVQKGYRNAEQEQLRKRNEQEEQHKQTSTTSTTSTPSNEANKGDESLYMTRDDMRVLVSDGGFFTLAVMRTLARDTGLTGEDTLRDVPNDGNGNYLIPDKMKPLTRDIGFYANAVFVPLWDFQALSVAHIIADWGILTIEDLQDIVKGTHIVLERKRIRRIATAVHKFAKGNEPTLRKRSSRRRKSKRDRGSKYYSTSLDDVATGVNRRPESMHAASAKSNTHVPLESSTDPMLRLNGISNNTETDVIAFKNSSLHGESSDEPTKILNRMSELVEATIKVDDVVTSDFAMTFGANSTPIHVHSSILKMANSGLVNESISDPSQRHFYSVETKFARYALRLFYAHVQEANEMPFVPLRDMFGVHKAATSLGLDWVEECIAKRLRSSITPQTCAYMLEMSTMLGLMDLSSDCSSLFCFKPKEVLASPGGLYMSESILMNLVRDDKLCLTENEVFHWVVQWGRFNAGFRMSASLRFDEPAFASLNDVSSSPMPFKPIEEVDAALQEFFPSSEREDVRDVVLPMVGRLRLLQFSPWFFDHVVRSVDLLDESDLHVRDQHVNGNNVLPLLSLHLRPRIGARLFFGSKTLTYEHQVTLNKWFGMPSALWSCVFSTANHGDFQSNVWKVCQRHRPLYTIIQTTTSHTFGCFTWDSWESAPDMSGSGVEVSKQARSGSSSRFSSALKSFVFLLQSPSTSQPIKFPANPGSGLRRERGACVSYGMQEGGPADVFITNGCSSNDQSFTCLGKGFDNGSYNESILSGEKNFGVAAMEIFALTDTKQSMSLV